MTWRIVLIVVGLCLVACGGGSTATATPSPDLGAQYLKLVAPVNSATEQANAAIQTSPLDVPRVKAATQALIDADVKFNSGLLTLEGEASSTVKPHIDAARTELSKEITDLQAIESCGDAACINSAVDRYLIDYNAGGSAFVLLRSDLGLAPPPVFSPTPS